MEVAYVSDDFIHAAVIVANVNRSVSFLSQSLKGYRWIFYSDFKFMFERTDSVSHIDEKLACLKIRFSTPLRFGWPVYLPFTYLWTYNLYGPVCNVFDGGKSITRAIGRVGP